jgi:hypothetical protein
MTTRNIRNTAVTIFVLTFNSLAGTVTDQAKLALEEAMLKEALALKALADHSGSSNRLHLLTEEVRKASKAVAQAEHKYGHAVLIDRVTDLKQIVAKAEIELKASLDVVDIAGTKDGPTRAGAKALINKKLVAYQRWQALFHSAIVEVNRYYVVVEAKKQEKTLAPAVK